MASLPPTARSRAGRRWWQLSTLSLLTAVTSAALVLGFEVYRLRQQTFIAGDRGGGFGESRYFALAWLRIDHRNTHTAPPDDVDPARFIRSMAFLDDLVTHPNVSSAVERDQNRDPASWLRARLIIYPRADPSQIAIGFYGRSPEEAAGIANAAAEVCVLAAPKQVAIFERASPPSIAVMPSPYPRLAVVTITGFVTPLLLIAVWQHLREEGA